MTKKIRILAADDEPAILRNIRDILVSEGYDVILARNGREAVEVFKKEFPDMVILDISMPYLSGIKAMDKIKKYFGERYIPVIFLTASVKIDDKLKALSGGACDYLTKPVSPEELLARIRNFLDIKTRHDRLKERATYDWMTGVLNKARFLEKARDELAGSLRHKTPLSFIFLDIDNFKNINDQKGHLAGDAVITEIAGRLKHCVRGQDLIGRFGGDEFVLMFPHKGIDKMPFIANRLKKNIEKKAVASDRERIKVTACMGIASIEGEEKASIDRLIKIADEALYEAKLKGAGRYVIKALH